MTAPEKAKEMISGGISRGQPREILICANLSSGNLMKKAGLFMEVVGTYRRHGWELRSALLQPSTFSEFHAEEAELLANVTVREATFDALWFSRPSHNKREAWE